MFQLLASVAGQAGEQRWWRDQISAIPLIRRTALFDNVDVVANLQREVVGFGSAERIDGNGMSEGWQRFPRHGGQVVGML